MHQLGVLFAPEFMPHGHCYFWEPGVLWLNVISDAIIALAYYTIPIALVYIVRRRKDLVIDWMFVLFAFFILACGTTHLVEIWNVWHSHYYMAGWIKFLTAAASILTAYLLWRLLPKLMTIPSARQLEDTNSKLIAEMNKREAAQILLAQQAEQLKNAIAFKGQFLANMSHEIRTPLTSIIGFTESVLGDDCPAEEQKQLLNTVLRNSKHLLTLIDDILDLSKIEAGKLVTDPVETNLSDLMMEVFNLTHRKASDSGLALNFYALGAMPKVIQTDPLRLKQILVNLISNAAKFQSTGEIQVQMICDQLNETLTFSVIDKGIGMSEEEQSRLFTAFSQADFSTTRRFGGTGLGLYISQQLAKALGGSISVKSKVGDGSTFTVTVPTGPLAKVELELGAQPVQRRNKSSYVAPPAPALKGHVLVAEDGPDNQAFISYLLKRVGVDFTLVENGKEALEAVAANKFDIILMDMQMPIMDGYVATKRLRENGFTNPIIAVSANAMAEDRQRCLDAGCTAHFGKPFEREKFYALLKQYLPEQRVSE